MRTDLPPELEPVREAARRALRPIIPANTDTKADQDFLFTAKRTEAGRKLPPYYLVYFVLVELLGFKNLGRFEKLAWSVPIDFHGRAFLIEHRKFGLGVFSHDPATDEADAREIVACVQKAVKAARPFFDWLATQAVETSKVNVVNNSGPLFDRFSYLLDAYRQKAKEAEDRREERIVEEGTSKDGGKWQKVSFPAMQLRTEAEWLGLAAIEAFFSWTEHIFIHIGILSSSIRTADEVAKVADADWGTKFKRAFDITDSVTKDFYDKLLSVRQELRNFVAHGAFGKQGEAFNFHSPAGAVPVLLPHRGAARKFSFGTRMAFDVDGAIRVIEAFTPHLWSGPRGPAEIYLQQYQLPLILTMAADGKYTRAMSSSEAMEQFARDLAYQVEQSWNMDW